MDYRHEWKHEISTSDMIAIRQRMRAIAKSDTHALDGKYRIRSLYFDNLADRALREKIDGVNCREKFRIRYYNGDPSQTTLTAWEVFCFAMLDFCKRGRLENTKLPYRLPSRMAGTKELPEVRKLNRDLRGRKSVYVQLEQ